MRIRRKGVQLKCTTFRVIPDEVLEMERTGQISAVEVMVFCHIQHFASKNNRGVGFNELARHLNRSRSTVAHALKRLTQLRLIVKLEDGSYAVNFNTHLIGSAPEVQETSSKIEPTSSKIEPIGSKIEPTSSKIEPPQVQNRPGNIKRHIETIETGACNLHEASPAAFDSWQTPRGILNSHINRSEKTPATVDTYEHARRQALAQFEQIFHFTPRHSTPHDWNLIMLCLANPDGKATARYLRELKP